MNAVASDSRYIPFTQQPYCCVPASLEMVLYKNGLPLLSQEEIGLELGLVVAKKDADLFSNVPAFDRPIVSSGFGTRVQDPDYGLDKLIKKYNWPFTPSLILASEIKSDQALLEQLKNAEERDDDVLICYLTDNGYGHVVVFDRLANGVIRVVDPEPNHAKWRTINPVDMFNRIQQHGDNNFGGLWVFKKIH